ncbi:hypothetical protein DW352_14100 [Pseudolabrys taiwanensis]|uniref:Uncharacterized protein n=1 Tax=Pseudolabrys taiwanensis TaxID=331696 RepID=A0A345ZXA0_9HYPH|nr:hypothetical protein DW352_14100 [Pseudolabrys taiwanensis]
MSILLIYASAYNTSIYAFAYNQESYCEVDIIGQFLRMKLEGVHGSLKATRCRAERIEMARAV